MFIYLFICFNKIIKNHQLRTKHKKYNINENFILHFKKKNYMNSMKQTYIILLRSEHYKV
jgi:hypothetical protein